MTTVTHVNCGTPRQYTASEGMTMFGAGEKVAEVMKSFFPKVG